MKQVAISICCQNQNTKTLQQGIANLKNELLSENDIITTPINKQTDLLEKSKSHATIQNYHLRANTDMTKDHNEKYMIPLQLYVRNELIKLNGITFQDMCLKIQKARLRCQALEQLVQLVGQIYKRFMI